MASRGGATGPFLLLATILAISAPRTVHGAVPPQNQWNVCPTAHNIRHVAASAAGSVPTNATSCMPGHTCCGAAYAADLVGCCPLESAVCCANKLLCCPKGTACVDTNVNGWPGWAVTTTCRSAAQPTASNAMGDQPSATICKAGPPQPLSTTQKNVLVIGDSVSIGYTPFVAAALADVALVQHSPWGGDGGAEETAYGLTCLDYLLRAPNGDDLTSPAPDVVMFNWGLHDGPQLFDEPPANVTIPGQEGNMTVYQSQLDQLTARLVQWAAPRGTKLLFAITSPVICRLQSDNDVRWLNVQAQQVMARHGVATVNLHDAVTGECGEAPQPSCLGVKDCFCPHCAPKGYEWLAQSTVAPAIRALL